MGLRSYFEQRYMQSLGEWRFYYDDLHEYGNPEKAEYVFYFIPGLNGVPGQLRFALPAFGRVFGSRFYIRGLHMYEYAADRPVWEKYTETNLLKRREVIRNDLSELVGRYGRVHVLASSTGFYEFAAAFSEFPPALRRFLTLLWVAAAPDSFTPSRWEAVFEPLSGIDRNGCRWIALPNHNAFSFLNPEAGSTFRWRTQSGARTLYKDNLESRFRAFGMSWAYFSRERTNWVMQDCVGRVKAPMEIDAFILTGTNDGYWQGMSPSEMKSVIDRYLSNPRYIWKKASHLWVTVPENVCELLATATGRVAVEETAPNAVAEAGGHNVFEDLEEMRFQH